MPPIKIKKEIDGDQRDHPVSEFTHEGNAVNFFFSSAAKSLKDVKDNNDSYIAEVN